MSLFPLSREQISEMEENLEVCTAIGTTRDGVADLCDMARGYLDERNKREQTPALVATSRAYSTAVTERNTARAALGRCRAIVEEYRAAAKVAYSDGAEEALNELVDAFAAALKEEA